MTETFTLVSNIPADSPAHLRKDTAGRPLPGAHIKIIDEESGVSLPFGEEGEIAVKGVSLMRGYYKVDPENVFDDEGFYRTQDRGFIDSDGYLHWNGRISNMIKTGGANVSPLEIETTLENFPNMRVGIPFGAPHPTLGEAVVLCAVASKGRTLQESEIQSHLNEKLAAYKRPKAILIFSESDLSFTGNQKIQVNLLIEKAKKRLRSEGRVIDGVNYSEYFSESEIGG
jgi:fatty-acyl-CoA synthase